MNKRQLLAKATNAPQNLHFTDFVTLVEAFGFYLDRQKGSHHIYRRPGLPVRLNIQPADGMAKAYQVRQFLTLVETYGLALED